MQGFYGSPRHGGNSNYVSYKMMKLDYPHVMGQNRYESKCAQQLPLPITPIGEEKKKENATV
jgi:hypothetical protein